MIRGFGRNPFKNPASKLSSALDQTAKLIESDFDEHGRHYTGGIDVKTTSPDPWSRLVATSDYRVALVDAGAKPHKITGNLVFQENYAAKTHPQTIPSRPGGSSGDFVYATSVQHPGFEAREVDETIASHIAKKFKALVIASLRS
jgi:hypothetical protein